MKRIITILLLVASSSAVLAQDATNKIVLAKNQQLKFTTTIKGNISQELEGQSIETIMDITATRTITVKDIIASNYQLDANTIHIMMNMSVMGQEKKFDSDNKDDMAGEMKEAGKDVNVVKKFTLSTDGKCIDEGKDTVAKTENVGAANMMQQMFGSGVDASTIASNFILIPEGKKIGDSWTDSVALGTTKTLWNYTWDSTFNHTALIKASTKLTINKTMDAQGMEIKMNLVNDVTETRKIDLKTGVVLNKISVSKLEGTMEAMGQSIPMSGTTTTTVTAE